MRSKVLLMFVVAVLATGCQTFITSDGRKHRQFRFFKDRTGLCDLDTGKYTMQPFDVTDYTGQVTLRNEKRVVEPLNGKDVNGFRKIKGPCYLYIWDQHCPANRSGIHKLDSLALTGVQIIVV